MHQPSPRSYLLVGGLGYIGGQTALALHDSGQQVTILDNMSTCDPNAWNRLHQHMPTSSFVQGDARNKNSVAEALLHNNADTVIHFAALKSVPESVAQPLTYHRHNNDALLTVLEAMDAQGVRTMVFSSSAAVYGDTPSPIQETAILRPSSPYGATKAWGEQVLRDLAASDPRWSIAALRYFNPIGADNALRHGDSIDTGTNVAAILTRALMHKTPFSITGNRLPTPDGSGLRDYIHIEDLAQAHVQTANWLHQRTGYSAFNVGTGIPVSVKELAQAFQEASGMPLTTTGQPPRPGDVAVCWADPNSINTTIGWSGDKNVTTMAMDHWRWALRCGEPQ